MPDCPNCATHLVRTHRTPLQKIVYSHVFECPHCDTRVRQTHSWFRLGDIGPLISRYTRCVRCGTFRVNRVAKRDWIDPVSNDVFGRLQWVFGAPLNKCNACRLQYYDWRPVKPNHQQDE